MTEFKEQFLQRKINYLTDKLKSIDLKSVGRGCGKTKMVTRTIINMCLDVSIYDDMILSNKRSRMYKMLRNKNG